MGLYSHFIVPRLLEKSMSDPIFTTIRKDLLAHAKGDVLEIGIGSGLNLAEYPSNITELTAIDSNAGFDPFLQKRIATSKINVHHLVASAEELPFADNAFNTVVSTWTFCSIENLDKALQEIRRVLTPDGKLLFVEHGLDDNRITRLLQHCLTPFWKRSMGGCHLNRDMKSIIESHGFLFDEYREYNVPGISRIARHMCQGIGRASEKSV